MTDVAVVDASAAVAFLVDTGPQGQWATATLKNRTVFAPHLLPFEVDSALRHQLRTAQIDLVTARRARRELTRRSFSLWPHASTSARAWELRGTISSYGAAYVALAEVVRAPLVTLDRRLTRAPGPRCTFLTPPA